jgi:predicted Kef-type K+ transport protein
METNSMKNLLTKITSGVAGAIVLLVGCAMAGLGLSVIAFLAMVTLAAIGLALLAKPFVSVVEQRGPEGQQGIFQDRPAAA